MDDVRIVGIRCSRSFDDILKHFLSLGGDVILMDPAHVYGKDHIISAMMHAERAFRNNTNRSKTMLTETILYAAGERQISKALAKMKPKEGCGAMVVAAFGIKDLRLDAIDAAEDDSIITCTSEKADIGANPLGIRPEDLALEMVAMMDIQKQ
ncbi:MAG: hypothetical protein FWD92_05810 [Methanomassiliicoccaceae archaeon]|nr:hypothetical protein [Methanomassiliicoccaceae archaeon]